MCDALRAGLRGGAAVLLRGLRGGVRDHSGSRAGQYLPAALARPGVAGAATRGERRPELARYIVARADGTYELTLAIDGLQCGACVWLIERCWPRARGAGGRVNMTTRRLRMVWRGAAEDAERLVDRIECLGYRLVPFDSAMLSAAQDSHRPRAAAGTGGGGVRRRQRDADLDRHLGRRPGGLLDDMGPATRVPAALGVGADRAAGDRLCGDAVLCAPPRRRCAMRGPTWTCRSASG